MLAANGTGKDAFWKSLLAGESGIGPITLFDTTDYNCKIAGEVKNLKYKHLLFGERIKARHLSRTTVLGYLAAEEAIQDAGLTDYHFADAAPVLVTFGAGLGGFDHIETQVLRVATLGPDKLHPHAVEACTHTAPASLVAALLRVPTQISTIANNCCSGTDAVVAAFEAIRSGRFDVAVCGATDAPIVPSVVAGFSAAGMVGGGDSPATASRPFDHQRTGGILAEGGGALILENLDHALSRGRVPYLEVLGAGQSRDMLDEPICEGLDRSITQALANASLMPDQVEYISAHGPSDRVADRIETEIIKKIFKQRAYRIPVSSIKSATGNPISAGGIHQVISCCLAYHHRKIPPTGNYRHPDPDCDLDYVPNEPRDSEARIMLVNSHGSGAANCSILLGGTGGT